MIYHIFTLLTPSALRAAACVCVHWRDCERANEDSLWSSHNSAARAGNPANSSPKRQYMRYGPLLESREEAVGTRRAWLESEPPAAQRSVCTLPELLLTSVFSRFKPLLDALAPRRHVVLLVGLQGRGKMSVLDAVDPPNSSPLGSALTVADIRSRRLFVAGAE